MKDTQIERKVKHEIKGNQDIGWTLINIHFQVNQLSHSSLTNTFARLLKLPNVIKPLERAGVGEIGPASGEGV
jgi:hypothetical protein